MRLGPGGLKGLVPFANGVQNDFSERNLHRWQQDREASRRSIWSSLYCCSRSENVRLEQSRPEAQVSGGTALELRNGIRWYIHQNFHASTKRRGQYQTKIHTRPDGFRCSGATQWSTDLDARQWGNTRPRVPDPLYPGVRLADLAVDSANRGTSSST